MLDVAVVADLQTRPKEERSPEAADTEADIVVVVVAADKGAAADTEGVVVAADIAFVAVCKQNGELG